MTTEYRGTWADATLSTLSYLVAPDAVAAAEPLAPDEPMERYVIMSSDGRLIDGSEQVARLLRWAEVSGADMNGIAIRILIAEDESGHRGLPDYAERKSGRIERMRERAKAQRAEAAHSFEAAHQIGSYIPFGQPILVGHHSERRHRRDLERIDTRMKRGVEAHKEAEQLERRADHADKNKTISSDDPAAVIKLRAKLADITEERALATKINAAIRKAKPSADRDWKPVARRLLQALGLRPQTIENALTPDFARRYGVPAYRLQNLGAEARRIEQRIKQLTTHAAPAPETHGDIRIDEFDNRVRLHFPAKPPDEIRILLKSRGFRWSPSEGVWQRLANSAAWHAARDVARIATKSEE